YERLADPAKAAEWAARFRASNERRAIVAPAPTDMVASRAVGAERERVESMRAFGSGAAAGIDQSIAEPMPPPGGQTSHSKGSGPGRGLRVRDELHQWRVLSRRSVDILLRNRHNLVPLFVTPAVITLLLCVLYGSGAFLADVPSPMTPPQVLFFLGFSA